MSNKLRRGLSGSRSFVGLAVMAIALAGCEAEVPTEEAPADVIPGLEISNARLMLAPVSNNPAAVYFDLAYSGEEGFSIDGAKVAGAKNAEVHATMEYDFKMQMGETAPIAITKGTEMTFEPGGTHVMAFELDDSVKPGTTTEVTLKIMGGDMHKFEAEVKAAGDER